MRRLLTVVATAAVALGVAVIGAPAAEAKALAMGQCTTSRNVVVAVDFGHWRGPIVRGCGSTPTTGFALLNQGGFQTEGTKHDGPAFICRIGSSAFRGGAGYPTKADEACAATPPASAYWSYWHADPGQDSWSYSQLGAMSYKPKPGSVELWQFGGTNVAGTKGQPTIRPDDVRAHNATSSGGGSRPSSTSAGRGAASEPAGAGPRSSAAGRDAATTAAGRPSSRPGSSAVSGSASARPSSPAAASTTAPRSTGAVAAPASGTSAPSVIDADPASAVSAPKSSGSVLPLVLGLGLAVVLAAGAGFTMLRRRRADPEL